MIPFSFCHPHAAGHAAGKTIETSMDEKSEIIRDFCPESCLNYTSEAGSMMNFLKKYSGLHPKYPRTTGPRLIS